MKPPFNLKTPLKAPPLTKNYSLVGVAFDYLMRFYLEYHNKKTIIQRNYWVADCSFKEIMRDVANRRLIEMELIQFYNSQNTLKSLIRRISSLYGQARYNYYTFLRTGTLTRDLIYSTIFLAKLDNYYRNLGNFPVGLITKSGQGSANFNRTNNFHNP